MAKKGYFTTGEFAKLCNVKKQTLFHYDDVGIFTPDIVGENGYRYYSYTQLETFSMLQIMRDMHMPLQEIKEHMDNRSPEQLIKLLEKKTLEIDERIARLQSAKKYLTSKIKITQEGINAPIGQVLIENLEDEYFITSDYSGSDTLRGAVEASNALFQFCHQLGIFSANSIGGMIPIKSVTVSGYSYAKFYTVVELKDLKKSQRKLATLDAGGPHLVYYDNHGYQNIHQICQKLIAYADEHHLKLGEYIYEDVILDDLSTKGFDNYLVKISTRIEE